MKNKNLGVVNEAHENKLIRHDMLFVIVLNLILLAVMIGLYFWNRSTGGVEDLFARVIKF